jgi:hypothetical protein
MKPTPNEAEEAEKVRKGLRMYLRHRPDLRKDLLALLGADDD